MILEFQKNIFTTSFFNFTNRSDRCARYVATAMPIQSYHTTLRRYRGDASAQHLRCR